MTATTTLTPEQVAQATREAAAKKDGKATGVAAVETVSGAAGAVASTAGKGVDATKGLFAHAKEVYDRDGLWAATKTFFGDLWDSGAGFLGMSDDPKKNKGSLNIGSILGMLLGGGGGWWLGNSIGGIPGMIFGGLMAVIGLVVGQQFGDGTINGWLGREPQRKYEKQKGIPGLAAAPEVQQEQQPVQVLASNNRQKLEAQQAQNQRPGINFALIKDTFPTPQDVAYAPTTPPLMDGAGYQQFRDDVRYQYTNANSGQVAAVGNTPGGQRPGWTIGGAPLPPRA